MSPKPNVHSHHCVDAMVCKSEMIELYIFILIAEQ